MATSTPLSIPCRHCGMPAIEVPGLPLCSWPVAWCNHTEEPSQAIEIRQIISVAQAHVSRIEEDLARLQILQTQLVHKRNEALACVDQHKYLLSPIRRLPAELLAVIFSFCLPTRSEQFDLRSEEEDLWRKRYFSINCREAPLLLGRVCRLWRAVALSTPSLWSSFSTAMIDTSMPHHTTSGAQTFLSRSGACPLSLSFGLGLATRALRNVVNTFASHSRRWQSLDLRVERMDVITELNQVKGAIPLLETLTLRVDGRYSSSDQCPFRGIFEVAPSLRKFHLSSKLQPLQIKIPWSQLTCFIWTGWSEHLEDYTNILRSCPNLTYCSFHFIPEPDNITQDLHVTHPNLRALFISYPTGLIGFLGCITLPALRALRLAGRTQPPLSGAPFALLFQRSSCVLDVAILEIYPVENLIECLETMPGLTQLELNTPLNYIAFVKVMQRLTYELPGNPRLCPHLQAISLPKDSSLDPPALFAFLKSRRKPKSFTSQVTLLQSIEIVSSSMPEMDLFVGLQRFRDEGLLVSVNDARGVSWFSKVAEVL
ncbi:hypothetical protein PILCRDRAFT_810534 [Piloderma croceum F 1598]|uniref:Uncharacterized protein n=1 Tax=Piloderma croceum (strain F 1598) TaxID=765440 RepID=A0A0C3BXK6_PILCF|nr:hypothetical protein PILCRDRAFT_810534 [Piloderma croceum F 1598]